VVDTSSRASGMRTFLIVWLGQLVSTFGSGLTAFAVGVWLFQQTGTVTPLALLLLFKTLPVIALSPFAGALVDRWDRRLVMLLADSAAACTTVLLALLFLGGRIERWQLYGLVALAAAAESLQVPAFLASVSLLVPEAQYGRAAGLVQVAQAVADILAPTLAGVLLVTIGVSGVLLIDFATFLVAVATLIAVRFPRVRPASPVQRSGRSQLREFAAGLHVIAARRGLPTLLGFFVIVSFLGGLIGALIQPLVLSFTTPQALGLILSVAGAGLLGGSLVLSAWGGPARQIDGVLAFCLTFGLCVAAIGLRPVGWLVGLAAFGAHFSAPFVNGLNQAIWQRAVEPAVQGRAFAVGQMATRASQALAFAAAGPLADRLFEPLMGAGGPLAGSVGTALGVGPGRGIGLIFMLAGLLTALTAVGGALSPRLRALEGEGVREGRVHLAH
jgi:DHA3 family macrolide efflux protein-like MFS transporter